MARQRPRPQRSRSEPLQELPESQAGRQTEDQTGDTGPIQYDPDAPSRGGDGLEVQDAPDTVDSFAVTDDLLDAQQELEQQIGGSDAFIQSLSDEVDDYVTSAERIIGTGVGFRSVGGVLSGDDPLIPDKISLSITRPGLTGNHSVA